MGILTTEQVTVRGKQYNVAITHDEYAPNPREFCPMGKLLYLSRSYDLSDACFAGTEASYTRYHLGDSWEEQEEFMLQAIANQENAHCTSLTELRRWFASEVIAMPVHLMHTCCGDRLVGYDVATTLQEGAGVYYVTRTQLRKEYAVKRVTKTILERALTHLRTELRDYDAYLAGEVYRWKCDEIEDACGGYLGDDFEKSWLLPSARSAIEQYQTHKIAKHCDALKHAIKLRHKPKNVDVLAMRVPFKL